MDTSGLVSIITPTRNYGHLIAETLHSVISQTYRPIELVIVDDGSTDNTQRIISDCDFSDVSHRVIKLGGVGLSSARNFGIEASSGSHLMFLDADDILEAHAVTSLMEKSSDIVVGEWRNFSDPQADTDIQRCVRHFGGSSIANMLHSRPVAGCFILRRCKARFDAAAKLSELLDFYLRLGPEGYAVAYVDFPVVSIRQHLTPSRLSIANDHTDPTHRLDIVKRHRHAYAALDAELRAAVDFITLDLVLRQYRRSGRIDDVSYDIDLANISAYGLMPQSWNALRFCGVRLGVMALSAYERFRP